MSAYRPDLRSRALGMSMMALLWTLLWTSVLMPCASTARAADAKAPAADNSAILPFLDEGTFIVARVDLDRVDVEALGKYMAQANERMMDALEFDNAQKAAFKVGMDSQVEKAKSWFTDMTAAGAKQVYILLDKADLTGADAGPVVIVPLTEGADSAKLQEIMKPDGPEQVTTQVIGQSVVLSGPNQIQRLKARIAPDAPKVAHPDLAAAFALAADAPLRIALVPTESSRKWVEENLPMLPEPLGGGETAILSRGVRYAGAGVVQKPETRMNLVIKCQDADKAKSLHEVMNKGLAFVKQQVVEDPKAKEMAKSILSLEPKIEGDSIHVSVDPMTIQMASFGMMSRRALAAPPADAPAPDAKPADKNGL